MKRILALLALLFGTVAVLPSTPVHAEVLPSGCAMQWVTVGSLKGARAKCDHYGSSYNVMRIKLWCRHTAANGNTNDYTSYGAWTETDNLAGNEFQWSTTYCASNDSRLTRQKQFCNNYSSPSCSEFVEL